MFVRQLCFVVVLAMVGLADDPQGFVGGESSATLDLASFVYGNATFQLIGKKLGIKIGDAASKIEKPTKVTFVFGTCSVSGRVFWHHRGKAAFEFENSDAVALQADASYDGKQLSVTGTNAQNNQPVTIAGDCSAGEIKDNGTLVVAVTAESNVPVTLTVEAPFAKEAASAGMAWYYIVGICVGCIVFVAALIGGGIFAWKKWGKGGKEKVDPTAKNPDGQPPNKANADGTAGVPPKAGESAVNLDGTAKAGANQNVAQSPARDGQVGGQVGNRVGGQVGNQAGGQVGNQAGGQVGEQIGVARARDADPTVRNAPAQPAVDAEEEERHRLQQQQQQQRAQAVGQQPAN